MASTPTQRILLNNKANDHVMRSPFTYMGSLSKEEEFQRSMQEQVRQQTIEWLEKPRSARD